MLAKIESILFFSMTRIRCILIFYLFYGINIMLNTLYSRSDLNNIL
jgi:hypothetical protein